jgi:trimethylamine--corrinoid protein Co-methyltransferase
MLRILSHDDLERIHGAALRILDEIGMKIDHPRAQDLLEGAGARVDRATNRVRLSPELVEAGTSSWWAIQASVRPWRTQARI